RGEGRQFPPTSVHLPCIVHCGAQHKDARKRRASVGGWDALQPPGCRLTRAARPTHGQKMPPLSRLDAAATAAPTVASRPRTRCPHRAPWSGGAGERSRRQRHDACLHDEVGRLYRAIDDEPSLTPKTRIVLKLLLLTGQRNSTVTGARVDELKNLDCANPTWVMKRARMKGKRDHSLPLPPLAAQLFRDAIATNDGSEFVFPSEGKENHFVRQTVAKAMQRVCARAEITGLRAHDFRRSINSWLHDEGVGYDVRSRLMAHSPPDITSLVYDQSKLIVPLREALVRWEKHVLACTSSSAKVLAMA